eukprot:GHVS01015762.1.p1 GENE.GHVS01015762.1~~GHVS01015762.1.p1  ORF type:complete len:264 (-),score=21.49 GHVS01015762.1:171-929(-)
MAVEANLELPKGWCKDNTDCQSLCLKNQIVGVSLKSAQTSQIETILLGGEVGLCLEVFDLWLTADNVDIMRQVTEEKNAAQRKALQVKFSDSLPVAFCKVKNLGEKSDCTDLEICPHYYKWQYNELRLNVGDTGICSNMPQFTNEDYDDGGFGDDKKTQVEQEMLDLLVNLTATAQGQSRPLVGFDTTRSNVDRVDQDLKEAQMDLMISDDKLLEPNNQILIARKAITNYLKITKAKLSSEILFIHLHDASP